VTAALTILDEPTKSATSLPQRSPGAFRADIEGMRALAVTIVVLFHAGVPSIAGGYVGVDVFFVISGFLITGHLLRELSRTGTISIAGFYARRAMRLLPAAAFVVVATLAVSWLWLPPLRVRDIAVDALTTTFYGVNYRLAAQGTDYLAAAQAPSPLQHFWSLAVEEQFYLAWPPVLLLIALACRDRFSTRARSGTIGVVLVVVVVVSFGLSVRLTATSAPWAYFGGHTRAWELALGALVALAAGRLATVPRAVVLAGRWLGVAGILAATVFFTEATAFPGYAAALPVLSTGLIVAVGCANSESRLLGSAPMLWIGRLSYSWYLWHWPVLIVGPFVFGDLSLIERLSLAGLSLILASITARQVENPLRAHWWLRERPGRGMATGLALSMATAAVAVWVPAIMPPTMGSGAATDTAGALSETSEAERTLTDLVRTSAHSQAVPANLAPSLTAAGTDVPRFYQDGCDPKFVEADVRKPCMYGDVNSPTTVVLFGDSHAGHWFPAFDQIARDRGWRLAVVTKSACPAATITVFMPALKREYTECDTWRRSAVDYIVSLRPILTVLSSNSHTAPLNVDGDPNEAWASAWATTVERVGKSGKVAFLSDTAWPEGNSPECVSNHLENVTGCGRERDKAFGDLHRRKLVADAARQHGAVVIDPAPWMCTDTFCPAIIGNVLVHKDDSHISATYARLVTPILEQHIAAMM